MVSIMFNHLLGDQPISSTQGTYAAFQYGSQLCTYQQIIDQPELAKGVQVVVLGWNCPNYARFEQALNQLSANFKSQTVLQLGAIEGELILLIELVEQLVQQQLFPIIICPNSQALLGQLKAYERKKQALTLALVSSQLDYQVAASNTQEGLLNQLLAYRPQLLDHLCCLGYQTYLVDPAAINQLDDYYVELYRLGLLQQQLEAVEPIVRQADLFSFELSAIRAADVPAVTNRNPNGFAAAQACRILRYASLNERLSSLSLHSFDLSIADGGQTANMLAQLVWFAIEGFGARSYESMDLSQDLQAYVVDNKALDMPLVFYKSPKTERWWMEIPKQLHPRQALVACSYQDYQWASTGELPDRLLNSIQRLT